MTLSNEKAHRMRSRIALRIAPWLADSMSEGSMRFYRQHFAYDGRPKRRFSTENAAREWTRKNGSKGAPLRAYRCGACRGWHVTSKVGLAVEANQQAKETA